MQIIIIRQTSRNLLTSHFRFIQNLSMKIQLLEEQNQKLVEENNCLRRDKSKLETELQYVRQIFTKGQIRKLQSGTHAQIKWSVEDIANSIGLFAAGPRSYRLLRKRNYPLPGESTLRRWAGKINVQPGMFNIL